MAWIARPLELEHVGGAVTPESDERPGVPIVTNMGFDAATMVLTQYAGGRGPGDCGAYGAWVWDGRRFAAVLRREMSPCRGADRGDWPEANRSNGPMECPSRPILKIFALKVSHLSWLRMPTTPLSADHRTSLRR